MEKYSFPNSPEYLNSYNINSKYIKYNRNKSAIRNNESSLNTIKNLSYLNSYKNASSPKTLKHSVEKRHNIINYSPISSKTENIANQNMPSLKLFHEKHSNFHKNKNKYVTINSLKDKLNSSLYTSYSRMNRSSKNFYPSSNINYLNNQNNIKSKIRDYSLNTNLRSNNNKFNDSFENNNYNNSNYKNITIKNVFNSPSISKSNHFIKMTNNNIKDFNTKSNENFNKYNMNTNINKLGESNNITNLKNYPNYSMSVKDTLINQLKYQVNDLKNKLYEKEKQLYSYFEETIYIVIT